MWNLITSDVRKKRKIYQSLPNRLLGVSTQRWSGIYPPESIMLFMCFFTVPPTTCAFLKLILVLYVCLFVCISHFSTWQWGIGSYDYIDSQKCTTPPKKVYLVSIIKGFRTIVFIFIVISTTFQSICPPAFFRCLSNSGTFTGLRTTSFIESTGVACSDSVIHKRVQVLSIPVLLLACSQDWTCNLQMIVSLEA